LRAGLRGSDIDDLPTQQDPAADSDLPEMGLPVPIRCTIASPLVRLGTPTTLCFGVSLSLLPRPWSTDGYRRR
jgi:hypothetical protein